MSGKKNQSDPLCDQLAAYEMGLLADAERLVYESHLDVCAECREELYAHAPAAVALTTEPGAYRAALEAASGGRSAGILHRLADRLRGLGPVRTLAPVAVAAILVLAILVPREGGDSPFADLVTLEVLPYTRVDVRAGGTDSTAAIFARGMEAYLAADYPTAAAELALVQARLRIESDTEPERPAGFAGQTALFRGVSLLLADQPEVAITALSEATDSPLPPVRDRARWYLGQAYLLTNQPVAAESLLAELEDSPVYRARARTLREALHDAQ